MSRELLLSLRRQLVGNEAVRLREAQLLSHRERRRTEAADAERFHSRFGLRADATDLFLGRAQDIDGGWYWVRLPEQDLLSLHGWVTGGTGAGKSFFVLSCLHQVIRRSPRPIVIVDLKGELAHLVTRVLLPAQAMSGDPSNLLRHLRVIRPFDRRFTPELRLTLPEPDVPREVQAFSIAAAIEEALDDDLRARMSRMFLHLVSFAIERNLPLTVLQRWLAQPATFTRDARVSQDAGIRQYAAGAFIREARGSVDALLARLDTFLFLRETRRALSAAHCVAFADCLDRGLTIIDLGDPPAGAERAARFWAGVLVGRLTRAILSRRLRHNSPHAWVILEEFQEAITGRQGQQFARLLALARHKRVALTFVNQQVAQLDTALVRILRTNTGYEAIFRSSFEDAKLIGHALPASRDDKRSQRQELIEAIPRLPNRTFYFWEKTMSAQRVRSPRVDLDALRSAARNAPPELRRFIRQGTVAVPSREIDLGPVECEPPAAPVTREVAFLTPNRTDDESAWPGLG